MRVELFFREPSAALITIGLLGSHSGPKFPSITGYNLPNKSNNEPVSANARFIQEAFPSSDLCVHYSLKYHATKRGEQTVAQFREFLDSCDHSKVLLVSGGAGGAPGKPRAAMNTVTCLAQLRRENYVLPTGKELGVAFNPYYPTPAAREDEWQRLRDKLDTGYVTSIWLNMGSDTTILQDTLEQLATMNLKERGVRILGSLFVPSKVCHAPRQTPVIPYHRPYLSQLPAPHSPTHPHHPFSPVTPIPTLPATNNRPSSPNLNSACGLVCTSPRSTWRR